MKKLLLFLSCMTMTVDNVVITKATKHAADYLNMSCAFIGYAAATNCALVTSRSDDETIVKIIKTTDEGKREVVKKYIYEAGTYIYPQRYNDGTLSWCAANCKTSPKKQCTYTFFDTRTTNANSEQVFDMSYTTIGYTGCALLDDKRIAPKYFAGARLLVFDDINQKKEKYMYDCFDNVKDESPLKTFWLIDNFFYKNSNPRNPLVEIVLFNNRPDTNHFGKDWFGYDLKSKHFFPFEMWHSSYDIAPNKESVVFVKDHKLFSMTLTVDNMPLYKSIEMPKGSYETLIPCFSLDATQIYCMKTNGLNSIRDELFVINDDLTDWKNIASFDKGTKSLFATKTGLIIARNDGTLQEVVIPNASH
jgi:hypothetical protein